MDELRTDLSVTAQINLYYDLHVPAGASNAPLLIVVHGYGAHKRYMMREAKLVAPDDFVIASLQAPHPHYRKTSDGYRVGFGWVSDHRPEEDINLHHRFIVDVIDSLHSVIDPGRIYLYGFSQACALSFRFAFTHGEALAGVIGVCGGIPGDLDTNAVYTPFTGDTLYLYGDDDEFYTQEQFATYDARLRSYLPNYSSRHYTAKHEITAEMRHDIREWLVDRVRRF